MSEELSYDIALSTPRCYAVMSYAVLATLMHDAEESDDDLTFMEISDEVFLARRTPENVWKKFYNQEWKKRMEAKAKR